MLRPNGDSGGSTAVKPDEISQSDDKDDESPKQKLEVNVGKNLLKLNATTPEQVEESNESDEDSAEDYANDEASKVFEAAFGFAEA